MKAIQYGSYGGPDNLRLVDLPEPSPGPGEVLIDVHAASLNPIDWKLRHGLLKELFPMEMPVVPGRDASGVVAGIGEGVTGYRPGDAVCLVAGRGRDGTWAERIVVDNRLLALKPERLSHVEAAALPLAGLSAWHALFVEADVRAGMKVLVHAGAGGVGGLAIQLAKIRGAEVAATCSAANVEYVHGLGAGPVIAYDERDFTQAISDYDVVLDCMGGEVHRRSYEVLKRGGVIACIRAEPYEDLSEQYGVSVRMARVAGNGAMLAELMALVQEGRVEPQVGTVLPLAEAAEAHRRSETGHARGKIVLTLRQ